jgi:hypothetical protein
MPPADFNAGRDITNGWCFVPVLPETVYDSDVAFRRELRGAQELVKKSKACQRRQTASPSPKTNLHSAFNAPSPLPLSATASADEFEEPSRRAEEKAV